MTREEKVIIEALDVITALRAVQSAYDDCQKASIRCQSDEYEVVYFQLKDELVALWKVADMAGIDMNKIRNALNS